MAIPSTYAVALAAAIFSMLCWGLWVNTLKMAGKRRFEFYSLDFAAGVLLGALLATLTFGTYGSDITSLDNLVIVRHLEIAQAMMAGLVFSVGNMLMLAGVTVAGMGVAIPITFSMALLVTTGWTYFSSNRISTPSFLFLGAALVVAAVLLAAGAYGSLLAAKKSAAPGKKAAKHPSSPVMGVLLAAFGGFVLGWFKPVVAVSRGGQIPLGPYPLALAASVGIVLGSCLCSLYFFNLPVKGAPVTYQSYFLDAFTRRWHGLLGGAVWSFGLIGYYAVTANESGVNLGRVLLYLTGPGAMVLAAACGLLIWREFAHAPSKGKLLIWLAVAVAAAGMVLLSTA